MKRAFTLVEAVVVLVIILILAAILFPVFARHHEPPPCKWRLKQIGLGFAQYAQDYNGRFPPARLTASTGWADVVYSYIETKPYSKERQVFQCPAAKNSTSSLTDYFYNSRVAGMAMGAFSATAQTVLTGEGDDDAPTWASLSQLPVAWKTDPQSPAWRHLEGGNYGFADGHVKWLKPSEISDFSPSVTKFTFAVR